MGQEHKTATKQMHAEPHHSGYNGAIFTPNDSYQYNGGWGRFVRVYKETQQVIVEIKKEKSENWDLYAEISADIMREMTVKTPFDKFADIASCLETAREKAENRGDEAWAVTALNVTYDSLSARLNGHSKSNGGKA